jgi:hypothetical protein
MRASRRVTTNPGVISYEVFGGETVYAARGDYWLGRDGERGVYEYGIGGKLLDVVELEQTTSCHLWSRRRVSLGVCS